MGNADWRREMASLSATSADVVGTPCSIVASGDGLLSSHERAGSFRSFVAVFTSGSKLDAARTIIGEG